MCVCIYIIIFYEIFFFRFFSSFCRRPDQKRPSHDIVHTYTYTHDLIIMCSLRVSCIILYLYTYIYKLYPALN